MWFLVPSGGSERDRILGLVPPPLRVHQDMEGTMTNPREFLPVDAVRPERAAVPEEAAVGLDYPSTSVGTVGQITVEYATSLGQNGQTLAQQLLNVVDPPNTQMESYFGVARGAVTVVVAPLSG